MIEFSEKKISDVCEVYDGPHATPQKTAIGPKFLSISSLVNGRLDLDQSEHISENDFIKWTKRVTPMAGDVVFSYETRLGEAALVPENLKCCLGRRLALLRVRDKNVLDSRYLLYYYLSPLFQGVIQQNTVYGSTVNRIALKEFPNFPIILPTITDQKAIAHILGALDDKIELNQRMKQALEDIAKAIFKCWFVDFDPVRAKAEGRPTGLPAEISDLFPDTFEDSEIGEIPAGWEVVPFTRTFQFFSGGTPKTSILEYWNGDIPWFSIADLNGGSPWVVRTEKSITELGLSKCSARLIDKGTTIVTARGTVGKVALAAQDMAINQSCYAMRALEGWSFGWLYLQTLALVDRLKANAHGSVFDTITRETFERFHVLMPCAAIMEIFHDTVTPLFERILCADNENLILSELRDTLLPKLISGELRIPDAEKFLAEAGI